MRFGKNRRRNIDANTPVQKENEDSTNAAAEVQEESAASDKDTAPEPEMDLSQEEEKGYYERKREERLNAYTRQKRNGDKAKNPLGLVGKTEAAKTFRLIVAAKDEQINDVLTKLLHDYNKENINILRHG